MTLKIISKNIRNLKRWLKEHPKDEDYLRLLKLYQEELVKHN